MNRTISDGGARPPIHVSDADRAIPFDATRAAPDGPDSGDESFAYWRTATDQPCLSGMKRQIETCEEYIAKLPPSRTSVFSDCCRNGMSLAGREGLRSLRSEALRRRPRRIVVEDLDRLARSLRDLIALHGEFNSLGIELHDAVRGRLELTHVVTFGYCGEAVRARFRQALARRRDGRGMRTRSH